MGHCCNHAQEFENNHLKIHWDDVYTKPSEKLGWYEKESTPTINIFKELELPESAHLFVAGAGTSSFVDFLAQNGYYNITVNDISANAIQQLKSRLQDYQSQIRYITEDISNPEKLNNIAPIDFWYDRAVLHFLTEPSEQKTYFDLLKSKIKPNSYVLLAQFNKQSAQKCSALPVHRYDLKEMQEHLGEEFKTINNFDYEYTMPNGDKRQYIYALFQKAGSK
ncbi:MAG TPA: methyltransferase type 12 [Flavobacteriales bacterium]|nr:methyltransferase type 12 [Flavobacteriales bacterium]|tara:strand:+ start:4587 stop:5252 length:666 start_codon:yes stop_codon:yes gene_type:complete